MGACERGRGRELRELHDGGAVRAALQASCCGTPIAAEGWSDADFAKAVEEGMARPERLASRLFGLRAESLLAGLAPERARARLSGLLVGAELAGAKPYWLGRDVVLSGAAVLVASYGAALRLCGLEPRVLDATEMTLAGLAAGYAELERSRT
jgi:2-dehydro-3-deoxygalactonokinase